MIEHPVPGETYWYGEFRKKLRRIVVEKEVEFNGRLHVKAMDEHYYEHENLYATVAEDVPQVAVAAGRVDVQCGGECGSDIGWRRQENLMSQQEPSPDRGRHAC
jgi:hypothetical protein